MVRISGKRGPLRSSVAWNSVIMNLPLPITNLPMCMVGVPFGAASFTGHCSEPASSSFLNETPLNDGVVAAISSMISEGCV